MGSGFMPWPSERAACVSWTRTTCLVGRRQRFASRHRAGSGLSVLLQPTVQATGPAWLRPGPPALQPRYRDRKRYIMIASQGQGATMLGEVWYSESERPE